MSDNEDVRNLRITELPAVCPKCAYILSQHGDLFRCAHCGWSGRTYEDVIRAQTAHA